MNRSVWPPFRMMQDADVDGVARLTLLGELDLAVADGLVLYLQERRAAGEKVRIDLSRLEFIDVRGATAIREAMRAGRTRQGDLVELHPDVSRPVRRLLDVLGMSAELVPADRGADLRAPRAVPDHHPSARPG